MDPVTWTLVWTDGSCLVNPGGPGGWAAVIIGANGARQEWSGGEPETTNNRMELQAPLQALTRLPAGSHVVITSDSQYVVKGMTEWMAGWLASGWKHGTVKNVDLWKQLTAAVERHTHVRWQWVRGHGTDPHNNRADVLANRAARDQTQIRRRTATAEVAVTQGCAAQSAPMQFTMGSLF